MTAAVLSSSTQPRPLVPRWARGLPLLLFALAGCRHKEKRVLRTEPWAAPVAISSASGAALPSAPEGKPVRYIVDQARVTLELPAKKKKPSGSLAKVSGEIDLDVLHPENTRAELRADLLSLSLGSNGRDESPELVAKAFDWLELSARKPPEEREKERYAKIEILGFDPVGGPDAAPQGRSARVVARGNLTLHHFRVPIALELDVQLRGGTTDEPSRLTIRTRRPLVVSLVAHDILPRDAAGSLVAGGVRSLGTEVGRDARVTAEISAVASGAPGQKQ
ncbi:MAG TPA: hypothetical protein VFQ35_00700 [Polyangiaceae bacterium]|nr:hypothetical protein [Polyangiaceae bacterium]